VLILMSKTGGGHLASAEALQAGFNQLCGSSVQVKIADLLRDHLPSPFSRLPNTYPFLANDVPWLWKKLWHTDMRHARPLVAVAGRASLPAVRRTLTTYAPDLIISVHPLAQGMVTPALAHLASPPRLATVVTDLASAHPLWFHPKVWRCYVASERSRQRALTCGLRSEQLRQFGLPIRPEFTRPAASPPAMRMRLGLPSALPLALLAGGGDGIGPLAETAQAVSMALSAGQKPHGQVVVICGHNQRLAQALRATRWPGPVHILEFVDNIAEWMQAADCLVTKAGPGTIAEAMACGLPLVLNGFIPGQEEGNVAYVVQNGLGVYHCTPERIGAQVRAWFGYSRAERHAISRHARLQARPQAAQEIVTDLLDGLKI
jgi:1,2-diacylglycerol 3-beta-galactosyltransferase